MRAAVLIMRVPTERNQEMNMNSLRIRLRELYMMMMDLTLGKKI